MNQAAIPSSKRSYKHVNIKWEHYCKKITLFTNFIITVGFNVLTSTGVIGKTQAELSAKYTTLLTPPGYTFSIWGVIYFFWALLVICQLVPNKYLSQPKLFYSKPYGGNIVYLIINLRNLALVKSIISF